MRFIVEVSVAAPFDSPPLAAKRKAPHLPKNSPGDGAFEPGASSPDATALDQRISERFAGGNGANPVRRLGRPRRPFKINRYRRKREAGV